MFTRLAKSGLLSGLARFWPAQPRRVAPAPQPAGPPTYCNDNLPGLRRPKERRRTPVPALACHWVDRGGRLECRWQAKPDGDAPSSGLGESGTTGQTSGLPLKPRGTIHKTVFELSYRSRPAGKAPSDLDLRSPLTARLHDGMARSDYSRSNDPIVLHARH